MNILQYIKRSLSIQPFQTIQMLQNKIMKKFNTHMTSQMISKYIRAAGLSKKKVTKRFYNVKDLKAHKLARKDFFKKTRNLIKSGKNVICLDESGINRNVYSKYGYSEKGKRLMADYYMKDLVQQNHSLLMAIDKKGIIKYTLQNKSFNGETFTNFVKELITEKGLKNTYFLMDNIRFHYKAVETINESGNHTLFIPPYSPDCNPIEEQFSSLKAHVIKHITPLHGKPNLEKIIKDYDNEKHETKKYYEHAFKIQIKDG